jgi:hypothetical protein
MPNVCKLLFGSKQELIKHITLCPGLDKTLSSLRSREMNYYNAVGMVALFRLLSGTMPRPLQYLHAEMEVNHKNSP